MNKMEEEDEGPDYDDLVKKFIERENALEEDPQTALDQLLSVAKREATWERKLAYLLQKKFRDI